MDLGGGAAGPTRLDRLADIACRRPRRVLLLTALAAAAVAAGAAPLVATLQTGRLEDPGSPSVQARERLERATGVRPDDEVLVLVAAPTARAAARRSREAARRIRAVEGVAGVRRVPSQADVRQYLLVSFGAAADERVRAATAEVRERLEGSRGVRLGGPGVASAQIDETVTSDLARAELLALPVLFALLGLIFRGIVPALLPVALAGMTVTTASLVLGALNQVVPLSVFALNLVAGLGLGLAVDYSLLMVARFREECGVHGPGPDALRATMRSAGRTVAFSAVTVMGAMAALLAFPMKFLYSMGVGGIVAALVSGMLALTALPAALLLLGDRIGRLRHAPRAGREGGWARVARAVMRWPGLSAIAAAGLLLALGLPALDMRYTVADARALPPEASARQVADAFARDRGGEPPAPAQVVLPAGRRERRRVDRVRAQVRQRTRLVPATATYAGRSTWTFSVALPQPATGAGAQRAVRELRAAVDAPRALVGGPTARFMDLKTGLRDALPLAATVLVAVTVAALFALTGSVVLAAKAVIVSALSIAAALGLLVLIFQDGVGGLVEGGGGIEVYQPILLGTLAFALATDYGVFLLARIKAFHDAGHDDAAAVRLGLQRSGSVVTAAALLFCVAAGALASSRLAFVQQLGIGAAVAVLLDATVTRAVLVPALMVLLGRWNWWAPAPLRRLHARTGARARG